MPTSLIVIGAGGFGRETLDVVEAMNAVGPQPTFGIVGVCDDGPSATNLKWLQEREVDYLGSIKELIAGHIPPSSFLIGIGNPETRLSVDRRLSLSGFIAATAIHPSAVIGSRFFAGPGSVICAGVQISTNVFVDNQVHLNPGAIVGHDSRIGNGTSINPGAIISGNVEVGDGCLVGAGAIVLQGLKIGENSVIGAGAVVTRDVAPNSTVKGIPAR